MTDGILKDTNPVISFLEFVIGSQPVDSMSGSDMTSSFRLTVDPDKKGINDAPWVKEMSIKRPVKNFNASQWTLQVFDPTFLLLTRMIVVWSGQNSLESGTFGSVQYRFGYVQADGTKVFSPPIRGMVLTILPKYRRQGVMITLKGVDFDIGSASTRIPLTAFVGITGIPMTSFITQVLGTAGVGVEVKYKPLELEEHLTTVGLGDFIGEDGNNYAGIITSLSQTLRRKKLDSLSITTFFYLIRDYCNYIEGDSRYQISIEASEDESSILAITIVDSTKVPGEVPVFVVNSTVGIDGKDNNSNVTSFVPDIEAFSPALFGATDAVVRTRDRFTRQARITNLEMKKASGPAFGEAVLLNPTVSRGDGLSFKQANNLKLNSAEAGDTLNSMLAESQTSYDHDVAERVQQQIMNTSVSRVIRASMGVAFPDPDLAPWSHIDVYVMTPNGPDPITSGRYVIDGASYKIAHGKYTGNFTMFKSGWVGDTEDSMPFVTKVVGFSDSTIENFLGQDSSGTGGE